MEQKIYYIDAFADQLFSGNPAAVCPLEQWPEDHLLQKIAMENNLAETAFYVPCKDGYQIRWFTPTVEVDLCGHATLAAAFVLFHFEGYAERTVHFFSSRNGELTVSKQGNLLTLNFPVDKFDPVSLTEGMTVAFNIEPQLAFKGKTDYMLVFKDEEEIKNLIPDLNIISKWEARGVIVTAKGNDVDFVARFFAPQSGINEDPVTGSAYTTLIPYWANESGKDEFTAVQLSSRKGYLYGKYLKDRVEISGKCVLYLTGIIYLE